MYLEGDFHPGHEQPLVTSGGLLQDVDHRVGEPEFVAAVHENLLHHGEQYLVAVGEQLRSGAAVGTDVPGGQPESAVGHQLHHRHQGADSVPGPEATVVVTPVLVAVGLRRGPVQARDGRLHLRHHGLRELHLAVEGGVDEQRRRRDRGEVAHPRRNGAHTRARMHGLVDRNVLAHRVQRMDQIPDLRHRVRLVLLQLTTQVLEGVHGGHGSPQAGDEELLFDQAAEERVDLICGGLREAVAQVGVEVEVGDGGTGHVHGGGHRPGVAHGYLDRGQELGVAVGRMVPAPQAGRRERGRRCWRSAVSASSTQGCAGGVGRCR